MLQVFPGFLLHVSELIVQLLELRNRRHAQEEDMFDEVWLIVHVAAKGAQDGFIEDLVMNEHLYHLFVGVVDRLDRL